LRGVSYTYGTPSTSNSDRPRGLGEPSAVEALRNVDLVVEPGERLGVVGPNGGGKSTMLKLVIGLLARQTGSIRVFGRSPAEARAAGLIGYVPQRSEADRSFPLSVSQAVAMPLAVRTPWWKRFRGGGSAVASTGRVGSVDAAGPVSVADRVAWALGLAGLEAMGARPVDQLSGGQFQRLLIARAILTRPGLLVLDEPTVGIDVSGQQRFATLMDRLSEELGLTVLIVSHDLRAIAAGCDRVACLAQTLHYHASPEGLTPAVLAEVFQHDLIGVFGDQSGRGRGHEHGPTCGHGHAHDHDDGQRAGPDRTDTAGGGAA
jgi:ABC-type Mn2+/Zn2+ transport system ATPase subunit